MLKYLFKAIYDDGSILQQTQDDVSATDPNRSAFYDIDHEKLIAFGIEDTSSAILVDLRDGSFQINGSTFQVYDQDVMNRRLIFFRRHAHNFNTDQEEIDHSIEYFIGWQGNLPQTGENIQRVLSFK